MSEASVSGSIAESLGTAETFRASAAGAGCGTSKRKGHTSAGYVWLPEGEFGITPRSKWGATFALQ